jgi:O-antigen ligase/tetratricopeptide (TPR) repeat protein
VGVYKMLSPAGARIRSAFVATGAFDGAKTLVEATSAAGADARMPISVDPASTRRDLSLLVLAVAVFLLAVRYFKTTRSLVVLCSVVAINGAVLAFFGIVQRLTWNGSLFWRIPVTSGGSPFGPFVNRNNAGGYLTLCLAGAVALLVWTFTRASDRNHAGMPPVEEWRGVGSSWRRRRAAFLANLDAPQVGVLVLIGCIVAGVLCSLSRGAFVALLGSALVTVLATCLVHRKLTAVWVLASGGLLALAVVGWVGMTETVGARLVSIVDQNRSEARLPHWRDTVGAARDYWMLGSGYGTYQNVYGAYQRHDDRTVHDHAENQFLEAFVTGGLPGLGLMLAAVVLAAVCAIRLLGFEASKPSHAFALMGIFALASQLIQGMFDFGLFIPSNLLLFALLMGAVAGRAALLSVERRARQWVALPSLKKVPVTPVVVIALLLGVVFGRLEMSRAAAVEAATPSAKPEVAPGRMSVAEIETATRRLEAAVSNRPDDAEAHFQLAELYVQLFRLRATQTVIQEQKAEGFEVRPGEVWPYTSTAQLHAQAHLLKDQPAEFAALRSRLRDDDDLRRALDHLQLSRGASPFLARTHVRLAELCFLEDDPDVDAAHLACARALAPGNAVLLFHLGVLHRNAGRYERALANWRECLALASDFDERVLDAAMNSGQFNAEEMIDAVLPASAERLAKLAQSQRLALDSQEGALLVSRAEASLQAADMPVADRQFLRGRLHAMRNDLESAAESYKQAVDLDQMNVEWQYELARTLKALGRYDEAQVHAEACVHLVRDVPKYEKLLSEIVRLKYPGKPTPAGSARSDARPRVEK